MGFHVSWIASSGNSSEELLGIAGLKLSGERQEFSDTGWYLLETKGDGSAAWTLLLADGRGVCDELDSQLAKRISRGSHEALFFWCDDTSMGTSLECYKHGEESLSVYYSCDYKDGQPAIRGAPPAIVHDLLSALCAEQEADSEADYIYSLTADLGQRLTGFQHDSHLEPSDPEPFQVLVPEQSRRAGQSGWLKRMLSRFGY